MTRRDSSVDFASVAVDDDDKSGATAASRSFATSSFENFTGKCHSRKTTHRTESFASASSASFSFIRSNRIRRQMHERQADFTEHVPVRCVACTWNVNGKKSQEDLQSWLMLDKISSETELPSIYAVGFQEIVDLNAVSVVSDSQSRERSSFWAARLSETLNRAADKLKCPNRKPRRYQLVLERHLVGILLCVFVLDTHIPHVRAPQATTSATGIMGIMGNKEAQRRGCRCTIRRFASCAHISRRTATTLRAEIQITTALYPRPDSRRRRCSQTMSEG